MVLRRLDDAMDVSQSLEQDRTLDGDLHRSIPRLYKTPDAPVVAGPRTLPRRFRRVARARGRRPPPLSRIFAVPSIPAKALLALKSPALDFSPA